VSLLKDHKIIKELGHGMVGTVYLIAGLKNKNNNKKPNTNKYALKIEHIEKRDLVPNTKSEVWREINFHLKFASKYPDQFVQLLEYDFIDKCTHTQIYSFDFDLFSIRLQNKLKKIASSEYCVRKIFDLVDGDLTKIFNKLSIKQVYSMIIQLTWAIKLLHSNHYIHGDIHGGNIGWKGTTKKYIQIEKYNIPTFGYLFKMIDFGLSMSKSDISNKKEENYFNNFLLNELAFIRYLFVDSKMDNYANKNKIKLDYNKLNLIFKKTEEYQIIKKFTINKQEQIFLFDILFPEQFQKIIFGSNYIKTIPRKLYIPLEDILVFIKISSDPNSVIKYFYEKIKQK